MATQNINIGVNVSDNGTAKKVVKNFQEIESAATRAQRAAADINAPQGGTSGSRAVYAKAAPSGSQQMMTGEDYGRARGSAGATGASARDFANQAQGLGGLVRLYATYAANIFAVSAAFNALSNAMDTANMVRGLDQLGASSGIALGSLAKRLATSTDNAISLREAMAATVKASSSGMNSEQILRMGQVAKKASIALGVDMSDAISRISRGITKLEPELLDELGLFTKTGKAAEDYAKSVNKSVAELTDFERRQAFANAVLAEGEKKFGGIDAKANSYTVLLSSIKDVSFTALNALNTVLGPVIGLLSQSPGALIAGMVGLATVVLKQAIPALGQMRENLENVAVAAASDSYDKAAKAQQVMANALNLELQQIEQGADAKLASVEKSEAQLAKAKFTGLKNSVQVEKLLNSTVQELREEDFAAASEVARQKEEDAKRWSQSASKTWQARGAAAQEEANITKQLVKEVREHKAAEETLTAAKEKAEKTVRSGAEAYTVLGQNLRLAEAANTQSVKKSIVSNAAYNASLIGLRGAAVLLKNEIDNSGLALTRLGTAALYARGGIAILTGAIATMGAAITKALNVVGILVTIFSLLDSFAGSKKVGTAMKDLSDSIDVANSSSKTFTDTISASYKGNMLAVTSLEAQSMALNEVSISLTKAADASIKAQKAVAQGNWYDKSIEFFKDAVGFGIGDKFQETLGNSISSAVDGLANSAEGENVKRKFADIFKIDPKSAQFEKQLKDRIDSLNLAPDSAEAKQSLEYLKQLGTAAGISASRAREFKDALDASVKATKELGDVYKVTNPITTFVETSLTSLKKLDLNLQEPKVEAFAENLLELSEKLANNPIFGPQQSAYLSSYSKQIKQLNTELTDSKKQLKDLQELQAPSKTVDAAELRRNLISSTRGTAGALNPTTAIPVADAMLKAMDASYNAAVSNLQGVVKASESGLRTIGAKFRDSIETGAKYNLELLIAQLQQTLAEGSTKFVQGILSSLSSKGIVGAAEQEKTLKLQELAAQRTSVTTMRDLIAAMKVNSATVALASARTEKEAADKAYYALPETATLDDKNKAITRSVSANIDLDQTTKNFDLVTKAVKNPIGALNELKGSFGIVGEAVRSNVMAIAQSMAGFTVQLQKFKSEEEQIVLDSQVKAVQEQYAAQQEVLNLRKQGLDTESKALQLSVQNRSLTEAQAAEQEDSLKLRAAMQAYDESVLKSKKEYAEISVLIDALDKKAVATKNEELKGVVATAKLTRDTALGAAQTNAEKLRGVDIDKIGTERRAKALQKELSDISKNYEVTQALAQLENTKNDIGIEQASKELELYSQAYGLSQEYVITQRTALEQEAARLSLTSAINQADQAMTKRVQEAAAEKKALGDSASAEALAKIDAETTRQQALSNIAVAGLSLQYNNKIAILEKTKEINLEQARYNELVAQTESLGQSLTAVFGNVGTAIGAAVSSMVSLAKTQQDNDKRVLAAKEKLAEYEENDDSDAKKKAIKDLTKAEKLKTITEIDGMAQIAGNTKKVFKEKTLAYKAFAAVEKTLHVISMAMKVKEMIQDGIALASKIATNGAGMASDVIAAGISGVKAVVEAIQGPFPMNVIAGAATAAVVAGLLSSIGGSGPSVGGGFVPNAEQRQETQGTAMGYDSSGAKVQVRRGVFGDTDAKSESIANSLELIRETSVDGLSYDNKMVTLLTSIDSGINKTAKGLYSIEGLRTGSMFGTVEGSQGGGFLRGKTSRNITDSGILIEGTFAQLASDTNAAVIDFFEQVTVSKKNWYGKTRTWIETNRREIDDATSDFFKDIFGNATKLFIEVGSKAGINASAVQSVLNNLDVGKEFASLRGLKGEEFQQELSAIIGTILDDASLAIFTSFTQYADFGEGMLETVIRVVDTNTKINQAVKNMGLTVDLTKLYGVTEALTQAAGGLEEFLDQSRYFTENFLTEAERVAPVQKAVVDRLAQLGYASVDTKVEFTALVKSLDLTSKSGIETYQSLMDLAPGFDTVIEAVETQSQALTDAAKGFRDFIQQIKDFKSSLLLGASSTLTPQEKYAQAKSQFENIYAQAVAGDTIAMSKVTSSAQSFLDASKTYFASSEAYTTDFNTVLTKLDAATISAGASASVAELQLSQLSIHTTLLSDISANIAVIAGVPQAARGGRVSGLTLVGEMGPELVDFTYPGQAYPADQTRGMFAPQSSVSSNMSQVVQELRQVKQELAQLRKDQQQQTGDLIISNYDANQKASEEIATAVVSTSQETAWNTRSKSEIK